MKRRLVGAVILVALAVILLPILLSGEREHAMPLFGTNIPQKPDALTDMSPLVPDGQVQGPESELPLRNLVDEHNIETPVLEESTIALDTVPDEVQTLETKPPVVDKPKPAIAQAPQTQEAPLAWVVQVGSFSKSQNAMALRDKLRSKHYPAFVESIGTQQGKVYRVRVGPELKQQKADKLKDKLSKEMQITGLVVRHP